MQFNYRRQEGYIFVGFYGGWFVCLSDSKITQKSEAGYYSVYAVPVQLRSGSGLALSGVHFSLIFTWFDVSLN